MDGGLTSVSCTKDAQIWGVNAANEIWYKPSPFGEYQKLDGAVTSLTVSADGNHVVSELGGSVLYRAGRGGEWSNIEGDGLSFSKVHINSDGSRIFGVADNSVYHTGTAGEGGWQKVSGGLAETNLKMAATPSVLEFLKGFTPEINKIAFSDDAAHIYGLTSANECYYKHGLEAGWQQLDGQFKDIFCSTDGEHVYGHKEDDTMQYKNGNNGDWEAIDGGVSILSVTNDGLHLWGINAGGLIFYRPGKDGPWKSIPGGLTSISCI
jgi:hypothetical protein